MVSDTVENPGETDACVASQLVGEGRYQSCEEFLSQTGKTWKPLHNSALKRRRHRHQYSVTMPDFRFLAFFLAGLVLAWPSAHATPAAFPAAREEQEVEYKSDYPSIVPPIWPETTSPPSPIVLHDDAVPDDDEIAPIPDSSPSSDPSTSSFPSDLPSSVPSDMPSMVPSDMPSFVPSLLPSEEPSLLPTIVFEAFGNLIIDDVPHGEDDFSVEEQNRLPETSKNGRSSASKKRRARSVEKPKKRSEIVRWLRKGFLGAGGADRH